MPDDPARELDALDAEVAGWYVHDGQLAEHPLGGLLSAHGRALRDRRLALVERLEAAGGIDPRPTLLRDPSDAQRRAHRHRHPAAPARLTDEELLEAVDLLTAKARRLVPLRRVGPPWRRRSKPVLDDGALRGLVGTVVVDTALLADGTVPLEEWRQHP